MSKGPDAFRTISEVAEELDLPQHVLRFWETRFTQIRPMKRGGGRRYYRPDDVELLRGIRRLLYGEGYTIKGVQRILKEQGLRHVATFGHDGMLDVPPPAIEDDDEMDVPIEVAAEGHLHRARPSEPAGRPERRDVVSERREPVFEARHAVPPLPRGPVRAAPEPIPSVSNFPAAPPDEPDSVETYLPPLVTAAVSPPPRHEPASAGDSHRPARTDERREGRVGNPAAAPHHEREPSPASRVSDAATHRPAAGLSREDVARLQAALVELLECKRLLDQSR